MDVLAAEGHVGGVPEVQCGTSGRFAGVAIGSNRKGINANMRHVHASAHDCERARSARAKGHMNVRETIM